MVQDVPTAETRVCVRDSFSSRFDIEFPVLMRTSVLALWERSSALAMARAGPRNLDNHNPEKIGFPRAGLI